MKLFSKHRPRFFRDATGRKWRILIDDCAAQRVKILTGVDLLDVGSEYFKLMAEPNRDPALRAEAVFAACMDEARARGVTEENFSLMLAQCATMADAFHALMEASFDLIKDKHLRGQLRAKYHKDSGREPAATKRRWFGFGK